MPIPVGSYNHHSKKRLTPLEVVGTVVSVLNIIATVIMAVEILIRFACFLKEWKPVRKNRKMGFYRKAGHQP